MTSHTLSPQIATWNELSTFLNTEFYQPDLEALRIVLAACRSQQFPGDPVWLFVVGPPGSGKTACIINCVSALPNAWIESSISTKTLLSCASVGDNTSLLTRIGSGILAFKDFTTILSKNEENQREIIAQLREVYDGKYSSKTGIKWSSWEGKITVIAAVTPAIERAWAVHRDLGERFMQVRWPNVNPSAIAAIARKQRGREHEIAKTMRELTQKFFSYSTNCPPLNDEYGHIFDCLAASVALLRSHVVRDKYSSRPIIDVSPPEEPTRIVKSLESVAIHHAALMGREVSPLDITIARRLAIDTVPAKRARILCALPIDSPQFLAWISELSGIPRSTVQWQIDEMEAIGVLSMVGEDPMHGKKYALSERFLELWRPTCLIIK